MKSKKMIPILVIALVISLVPSAVMAADDNSLENANAITTNHSDITNYNVWLSRFLTDTLTYDYMVTFPKRNQSEPNDSFTITQNISSYTGGVEPRGILLYDKKKENWWAYVYKDNGTIKTSLKSFAYYRNSTSEPYKYAGPIEGGTNKPYDQLTIYPSLFPGSGGSQLGYLISTDKLSMTNDTLYGDFISGLTYSGTIELENIRMSGQEISLDFFWDSTSYSNMNLVALIYM